MKESLQEKEGLLLHNNRAIKMYNHDLFIEKLSEIDSKEAQYQMLRTYMLGLPAEEFDRFLFGNLEQIKFGITELSASGELTKEDRLDFSKTVDGLIAIAQSLQKPSRVAAKKLHRESLALTQ